MGLALSRGHATLPPYRTDGRGGISPSRSRACKHAELSLSRASRGLVVPLCHGWASRIIERSYVPANSTCMCMTCDGHQASVNARGSAATTPAPGCLVSCRELLGTSNVVFSLLPGTSCLEFGIHGLGRDSQRKRELFLCTQNLKPPVAAPAARIQQASRLRFEHEQT